VPSPLPRRRRRPAAEGQTKGGIPGRRSRPARDPRRECDPVEVRVGRITAVESAELSRRQLAVIGDLLRRRTLRSRGTDDRGGEEHG
jgi:hypothetical protein